MTDLADVIDEFQKAYGVSETFKNARSFMAAYLSLIEIHVPEVVRAAVKIVTEVDSGSESPRSLEAARIKCWNFLDSKSDSTNFSDIETCMVRAAICFLYADSPTDNVDELVTWFLSLTDKVNGNEIDIDVLSKRFFSTKHQA